MTAAPLLRMTDAEFLAFENASEVRHELIDGVPVAMSAGTTEHALVAANLIRALGDALRDKPCVVLTSDQRVHIPATGLYTYPDVTVVCEGVERHALDRQTILNPKLVLEVLSPSTEAYDRGAKFAHYRSLPSLAEYVLVAPTDRRVESFHRREAGEWAFVEHHDVLRIASLGVEVEVAEIFHKLDLLVG